MSYSDWERNRAWLRAKAKHARCLSTEEEEYLDRELAIKLRERMEYEASVRWWQLFGVEGHRLDCIEAEAQFIGHLDDIFKYPPASAWDWPLFCQLAQVGGRWPANVLVEPTDLNEMCSGAALTIEIENLLVEPPHHALDDARLMRDIYLQIEATPTGV